MQKGTGLNLGLRYVPESTAQGIRRLPEHQQAQIQEIRLRVQQLPRVYDGRTEQPLPGCEPLRQAQLQACLKTACADSLYSFQRELSQGFVTVEGGNRIGFCGNGVIRDGEVETIRYVSSLNIRIAKQVLGCGQALYEKLFAQSRQSVLLLGPPASGKTTMLRDLCRLLGGRYRVSVVDERGELAACRQGIPTYDLGAMTDVFDGYPKDQGMQIALRVMTPDYIICDELGSEAETAAVLASMNSGVSILATAHAGSLAQTERRPQLRCLLDAGVFRWGVLLGGCGQVVGIQRLQHD